MIFKILPLALLVGVGNSLYIDTNKAEDKANLNESDNDWNFIKVYQNPPNHQNWYKYEPFAYPKYEFEYAVADKKTGDFKRHKEFRDGDRVHGEYSLIEPDGSLRKVEYNADDHNGFNAIVSKGYQKHGDHAYSQFGHTRFFAPITHKVKINNYFTDNMNSYNNKEKPIADDKVKPVIEVPEEKKPNKELIKPIVMNDINGKMVILVPTESMGSVDSVSSIKPIDLPVMPPKDMTDVLSMVMQVPSESPKIETSNEETQSKNSVEIEQSKPIVIADKSEMVPDNKATIPSETIPDSNVASSYYHSRIYYGFS